MAGRSQRTSFLKEVTRFKSDVWGILAVNKAFEIIADVIFVYAATIAPVALVTVVGAVQWFFLLIEGIILSVFFAHIIKEDISRKTISIKLVAITVIVLGMYLLSV